jgi:hypothetical protein
MMRLRLLSAAILLVGIMAHAQQVPSPQEQRLLDLTNQVRAEQGFSPLQWDSALAVAARAHTEQMIERRLLSHQLPGEPDLASRAGQDGAHFRIVAENIGMAGSIDALQAEWMHSPPHRANILDPKLDHVGIGVFQRAGYWYASVDFDSAVASIGHSQTEQQIAELLRQRGISAFRVPDAARTDCAMEDGDSSGTRPRFIMRWESSTLDRLPAPLEERIQTGRYTAASVGACGSGAGNQGFTTYRLAVLLY